MKGYLSTLFVSFLISLNAFCCDFAFSPFCIAVDSIPQASIFIGRITEQDLDGLKLELIEVLRGDQNLSTVQIWDGTDINCNGPFLMNTQQYGMPGDTVICLVESVDTIINPWEVLGDFRRPSSLNYGTFLSVTAGMIGPDRSYEQFVVDWFAGNCSTLVSTSEIQLLNLEIYPNPSIETLIFENPSFLYQSYRIYDWSGRYLLGGPLKPDLNTINVSPLAAGMHILKLELENGTTASTRFIKQ